MTRNDRLTFVFLLVLAAGTWAPFCTAELQANIDDRALAVSGLSPGGDLAVLSVWRHRIYDVATQIVHVAEMATDDDGDGIVRLDFEDAIPTASLWVVVDVTSGALVTLAPDGYRVRTIEGDGRGIGRALGRLEISREDLLMLAVRPGVGAWSLAVSDGGPEDEDGEQNGRTAARLGGLLPLGDSPLAPGAGFEPGDVVAAIDSRTMSLSTLRISP